MAAKTKQEVYVLVAISLRHLDRRTEHNLTAKIVKACRAVVAM